MKSWDEFYASLTKRAASAQLIIENTRGEVLVVKAHYKPYWSLPGGMIDSGESPRTTAVREVSEEVGLTIDIATIEFTATIVRKSRRAITYLFVFRSTVALQPDASVVIDRKEITEYAWVSKQDVNERHNDRHFSRAVKNWASETPEMYVESANSVR